MRVKSATVFVTLAALATPGIAHAQHISTMVAALALSPILVFLLAIILGVVSRSWIVGVAHAGLVGTWILLLGIASYWVENDYVIWTPLALYVLHAVIMVVLITSKIVRQKSGSASANRSWRVAVIVTIFAAGLLLVAALRFLDHRTEDPPALAAYATLIYVGLTVLVAFLLIRAGAPIRRLGFTMTVGPWKVIAFALLGVAVLQFSSFVLAPIWEQVFGTGRDLTRFSGVAGSPKALVQLLLLNWSVAAFGEELAFRIVLMRGIAYALGDGRGAFAIALVLQAIIFGLIHSYQGPAGVAGTAISGIVYGGLTLAARWSIWPAAIAHGLNNTIGILELYNA